MRESFVFYRSFYEALADLSDEEFGKVVKAVCEYSLNDVPPDLGGIHMSFFRLIKPQIDANNRRYQNGKKGGAPKGNQNAKTTEKQPKDNQKQPNVNVNDNVNDNENVNTICSPVANFENISEPDCEKVFEKLWALYPVKRGKGKVTEANKRHILDIGLDEMRRAVERYKADLAKETWRKPQNGGNFFNGGYVDYLDDNYAPVPETKPETRQTRFANFPQRQWDFDEMQRMEDERRDRQRGIIQ